MVRAIPRLVAQRELMVLPARQVAAGNLKRGAQQSILSTLRRTARDGGDGPKRASGLEAFALVRQMNDRARAEGRLWEQMHPAETATV